VSFNDTSVDFISQCASHNEFQIINLTFDLELSCNLVAFYFEFFSSTTIFKVCFKLYLEFRDSANILKMDIL